MDSQRLKITLVEDDLATRQVPGSFKQPSHFPARAAGMGKYIIRQRLIQANQCLGQLRPTMAFALLQAPGIPSEDWLQRWYQRWYVMVGWAMTHHKLRTAKDVFQQGLELFDALQRQPQTAALVPPEQGEWLRYYLGISHCQDDQLIQALHCYRKGLAAIIDGTIRDPKLTMLLYQGLGHAYLALGANAEAILYLSLAKEYGQDAYDSCAEGVTEWSLGLAYTQQGKLIQARQALNRALQRFELLEIPLPVVRVRAHLGQVLLEQQYEEEADVLLRQTLQGAEHLGDSQTCGEVLESLARLHLVRGKTEDAIQLIQIGLAILEETRDRSTAGQLYLTLAYANQMRYNHEAAEEAFKTAIDLLHSTPHRGLIIRVHEGYGQFLADQRRFREAYEQLVIASQQTIP